MVSHHIITVVVKWFSDPRNSPAQFPELHYDFRIQNICLALAACLQFRPCHNYRKIVLSFFFPWTNLTCKTSFYCNKMGFTRPVTQLGAKRLILIWLLLMSDVTDIIYSLILMSQDALSIPGFDFKQFTHRN